MDFSFLQPDLKLPVHGPRDIRDRSTMRRFPGNIGAPKDGLV